MEILSVYEALALGVSDGLLRDEQVPLKTEKKSLEAPTEQPKEEVVAVEEDAEEVILIQEKTTHQSSGFGRAEGLVYDHIIGNVPDVESLPQALDRIDQNKGSFVPAFFTEVPVNNVVLDTGNAICNIIIGTEFKDILNGTECNDLIQGLGGNDTLRGKEGDDILNGGDGKDKLRGNLGDDVLNGGNGKDNLRGNAGDDVLNGGNGKDNLRGDAGDDILNGGEGKDTLKGNAGDDVLNGDNGNDKLLGGSGADELFGGDGNDDLRGQGGNDILNGGLGNDIIRGNGGQDTFRISMDMANSGDKDIIKDYKFNIGETVIFEDVIAGSTSLSDIIGSDADVTDDGSSVTVHFTLNDNVSTFTQVFESIGTGAVDTIAELETVINYQMEV